MTHNDRYAGPETSQDAPVLSWTVHLAKQQPGKLAIVLPVCLIASLCAYFVSGPVGVFLVSAVLVASLSDFIFPVHFIITPQKATCKRLVGFTEIEWKNVKHCYLDEFGVKLSPLPRRTRLEAYRGVYFRFNDNKEQVIETVRSLRPETC